MKSQQHVGLNIMLTTNREFNLQVHCGDFDHKENSGVVNNME